VRRSPSSRSPRRVGVVLTLACLALLAATSLPATGALMTSAAAATGTFTTRAACSTGTGFPAAVQALGPTFYYRFGEAAGATTVADSSGNGNNGIVRQSSPTAGTAPPVTLGAAGSGLIACDTTQGLTSASTPAAVGSGSFVVWPSARPNRNTFTEMAWVRTTSSTGGRVIGMSSSTWAQDVHYDRQIVIDDGGHARFEIYPGFRYTLTSSMAVNDGRPHFLVATLGPGGAALYVDGVRDQYDPTQTTAETYTANETAIPPPPGPPTPNGQGYWRVGWDNINGWGATDYGLAGVIDEAALFENRALTPAEVAALWSTNHW
jgi:hypothetical protein